MLIAEQSHELIEASHADRKLTYDCPTCHESVVLKRGDVNIAHFAHRKESTCRAFSKNESVAHLQAKLLIADYLKQANITHQLEAPLMDIQQRPDILIEKEANKLHSRFNSRRLV